MTGLDRQVPGLCRQTQILLVRRMVQWWRMSEQRVPFLGALIVAALFFACLDRWWVPLALWSVRPLLFTHTTLALLLSIFCLHVFGSNQPLFWRERQRGISVLGTFIARVLINALDVILQTFVFTTVYFIVRQPRIPYAHWMWPMILTAFAAAGWGYLVSTLVPERHGPFMVTLVVFVTCGLIANPDKLDKFLHGGFMEYVVDLTSITSWSNAMSFCRAKETLHLHLTDPVDIAEYAFQEDLYTRRDWGFGPCSTPPYAITLIGVLLLLASFTGLWFRNRDKHV
mmetsp:Transcript_96570/g.242231  ORF Transcript_96570/g.242231 Transcript_96570/m.242231 type:complete len:284 (+) Transcript_96570:3-854(+)